MLLFDAYLSTPRFIKRLTQISEELISQPNQAQFLREKLREVNQQLPGSVYIPFLNQSMRNFCVLQIVTEEARIFKTKERAPVLLTLEVFRPVELALQKTPMYVQVSSLLQEPLLNDSRPAKSYSRSFQTQQTNSLFETTSTVQRSNDFRASTQQLSTLETMADDQASKVLTINMINP